MPDTDPAQSTPPPIAAHRRGVPRRGWSILAAAMISVLLVAAAFAALISKATWGYFFARPAPDARVLAASEVASVTFFDQIENSDGSSHFAVIGAYGGPGWYETEKSLNPSEYDYYLLRRRPLRALELRGTLDGPRPSLKTDELPDLAALLHDVLAAESPGFERTLVKPRSGPPTRGVMYRLIGAGGERLLLLAVECCWVSNDHYPYYEVLFEERAGEPPRPLSTSRFYFDIAGFEGMEFPQIFLALSTVGLTMVLPPITCWLLYRRFASSTAIRRGHCPRCRYDLCADFARGCPECGWGRGERAAEELDLKRYTLSAAVTRRVTSPPGWPTVTAAAIASGLVLVGVSSPGQTPRLIALGTLLGILTSGVVFLKLIGYIVWPRRIARPRRNIAGFIVVAAIAALSWWATATDASLRLRFRLSKPEFDRLIVGAPLVMPRPVPDRAGLFRISSVGRYNEGVFVLVPGAAARYANGFVCYPDGLPTNPVAWGKRIECTPVAERWYVWRYVR